MTGKYILNGRNAVRHAALRNPELIFRKIKFLHSIPLEIFSAPPLSIPINKFWAFCDGSYRKRTGGQWAFICNGVPRSGKVLSLIQSPVISELCAIYMALSFAIFCGMDQITIVTDSQYAISRLTIQDPENSSPSHAKVRVEKSFISLIRTQFTQVGVLLFHVKSHSGVYWNEMADELARGVSAS